MTTLYELLGVAPKATLATIKAAHRALAREHHPDLGGDAAKCAEVNVAWDVLSNAKTRRVYDLTLQSTARTPCPKCAGTGSLIKQQGFKKRVAVTCPACTGMGVI